MLHFFLGAVGIDDVGVFQLTYQIGFDGVNIDPAQLIPFGGFLRGQAFLRAITSFIFIAVTSHKNNQI